MLPLELPTELKFCLRTHFDCELAFVSIWSRAVWQRRYIDLFISARSRFQAAAEDCVSS